MYSLDYFYYREAEQFTFYRIPKALFSDARFSPLSTDAKLLYGLMLDRMGLSLLNKWIDDLGRVYIYYTVKDAEEQLCCSTGKAVKLFSELEPVPKGVGLIERVKQGQGRPAIIYPKNFASDAPPNPDLQNLEVKTSKNRKSRLPKNGSADLQKLEPNDIEYNNTEGINLSIMGSGAAAPLFSCSGLVHEDIRELVFKNIEYELLCRKRPLDQELLVELVELIVAAVCNQASVQKIGDAQYPTGYVRDRMMRLDASHIEYAMDCLAKTTSKIGNIQAYLLSTLFNAPTTLNSYYQAKVNHDLK